MVKTRTLGPTPLLFAKSYKNMGPQPSPNSFYPSPAPFWFYKSAVLDWL